MRNSVQTSILEVPGFTSKYIGSKGLGLDGCLQMAFQLAHYQLHGLLSHLLSALPPPHHLPSSCTRMRGLRQDGRVQMLADPALAHVCSWVSNRHSAATYESANQSAYKHGRTETVRSCTPESDAMCKARIYRACGRDRCNDCTGVGED